MATGGGFWKKVAGAFVEFEEQPGGARRPPTPPSAGNVDADIASAEQLLRELERGKKSDPFPPTGGASGARPGAAPPAASAPPPPSQPATASPTGAAASVPEGAAFSDLYTGAGIATPHHTAEQMLAILDGLAAMPPEACRLAVQAMDAADDRWTVADVLRDANAKVEVLSRFTSEVSQRAIGAAAQAEADRLAIDKNLVEAESTIQAQIAALQAELESFRTEAANERARVDAQLTTIQEAVARESARVQSEIARLGRVRTFLDPLVNTGAPASQFGAPAPQPGAPAPGRPS